MRTGGLLLSLHLKQDLIAKWYGRSDSDSASDSEASDASEDSAVLDRDSNTTAVARPRKLRRRSGSEGGGVGDSAEAASREGGAAPTACPPTTANVHATPLHVASHDNGGGGGRAPSSSTAVAGPRRVSSKCAASNASATLALPSSWSEVDSAGTGKTEETKKRKEADALGRVRRQEHVDGMWPTLVYLEGES